MAEDEVKQLATLLADAEVDNPPAGSPEEAIEKPAPKWSAVRIDYEDKTIPVVEVAKRHGISKYVLLHKAKVDGWKPRATNRKVDRPGIISRMFRLLERQVIQMERDMTETGEKEVVVLGKLASTLEKLIDIDNAAGPKKPAVQRKDMQQLRHKLAQRIAQLQHD